MIIFVSMVHDGLMVPFACMQIFGLTNDKNLFVKLICMMPPVRIV